jgi:DNA-binding CsgD family transcriptional regulator
MTLAQALERLADGVGAKAAAISRHHHRTEERPRQVAVFGGGFDVSLTKPFCHHVLCYRFGRARVGSAWFLGEMLDDPTWVPSYDLDGWLNASEAREIAVIPMASTPQHTDYIEFPFDEPFSRSAQHAFEALVPTIQRSWAGRKPGLVARATADGRALLAHRSETTGPTVWTTSILGMDNPAGLSRAEFRVCLLLSRGLSVKAVSEDLNLSENTIRSHLRAIYSKTETASLPELIYLIMSVTDSEASFVQAAKLA